jgi:aryl-alcohol dehydrogenase-like predicted oxidoreductase
VKQLCVGTVQFGLPYGIANTNGKPSQDKITTIIREAHRNGIGFFDTAQSYGNSETALGNAFTELEIAGQVKVITKLRPDFKFTNAEALVQSVRNSLQKLRCQRLWGLMLHRAPADENWNQFVDVLNELKTRKEIHNFGISCYSPNEALKFIRMPFVNILQVPFNVMDRRWLDNDFFTIAEKLGKKVFVRSAYLQGLLLMNEKALRQKDKEWTLPYLSLLTKFLNENGLDRKSFAINAIRNAVPDAKIVVGIDTLEQLSENIAIFDAGKTDSGLFEEWWKMLPLFPEKLLNPSLW